jgi:porphobilinogen synthase
MRRLVRETRLHPNALVLPLFVKESATQPIPIGTMPGVVQHSFDSLPGVVEQAAAAGLGGVMLFAIPDVRDAIGSRATDDDGPLTRAVAIAHKVAGDGLTVAADLCLDEFTDHGHCGVLDARGGVDNDATLIRYNEMALVLAAAGADILGASGMMDGQIGSTRVALDNAGFTDTALLAYAAKYASAFYGPFRDAVESQLEGDRRTYQQDPGNRRESIREVRLDIEQGADIVMVKPGLPYLDVLADVAASVDVPVAAYQVSGEYAMVEAAAQLGYIDRERAILESLTSLHRAGADIVATYWALEIAQLIAAGRDS